ncbi:hypothetical protein D9758_007304 [Tetrapyrgos nigripes]|uniref:Uncharacterized protein n=1 Tax=Tetrapyrgos nigripes TaxID=182062 RepID=A0A8H5GB61_9AGAR|nr:hypothetical protein D9758_007304 [Tetrapyrgos nigripes]
MFYLQQAGDLNSSYEAIPDTWARYQVFGHLAQSRDKGILSFITTSNIARDMLAMTEALGQEKLLYYGESFSTAMGLQCAPGAVFATMFPDKVGRIVIDGVVDPDGWFTNDLDSQMADTDKAMQISSTVVNLLPVPVFSSQDSNIHGVITYDLLRSIIFNFALNSPLAFFPTLAAGWAELSAGNGTLI